QRFGGWSGNQGVGSWAFRGSVRTQRGIDKEQGTGRGGCGPTACFTCGQEGHWRANCPQAGKIYCKYCKQVGHLLKDCPTRPPRQPCPHRGLNPQPKQSVCFICGQERYWRIDCPQKGCAYCKQESHLKRNCPMHPLGLFLQTPTSSQVGMRK
uniref:CCHC-type domain-containing protein n=1 Tax=Chelonoidis abingdonii TaxID=106734 RepID=A0A8C0J2Y9_CHEAB